MMKFLFRRTLGKVEEFPIVIRYGWTPSEEVVHALPPKLLGQLMKIYKKGMSITEMEARLFIQQNWNKRKSLFCFLRDSTCLE